VIGRRGNPPIGVQNWPHAIRQSHSNASPDAVSANEGIQSIEMVLIVWKLQETDWNHPVKKVFNVGRDYWDASPNVILQLENVNAMSQKRCQLFSIREGNSISWILLNKSQFALSMSYGLVSENDNLLFLVGYLRCYYGESLGDYCQIEGLCTATTINATCKTGVCQCKDGYVPSWDKSRCLPISTQGINSSCEENIQCEKSILGTLSECNQESMRCQCYQIPMVPTVFHSGRCYFGASLGDVCQVSAQCTATTESSICGSDGKCRCNETDGFVPDSVGVTCLPIVSGDDASTSECLEDIQCTRTLGHFSRCNPKQRKCECFTPEDNLQLTEKDEKPMVIVGAKCYEAKGIGEICKYNQECAVFTRNSICVNETCQCEPEGYVLAGGVDGKRCLEIGMDGLGSPCEEDVQCTHSILGPLARCDPLMKNCTCSNILPVVYYDKACFFHRQLGTPCESNLECKAAGNYFAECIEERCHCRHGMESAGQSCIPSTSESRSGGSIPYSGFYSLIITCLALMYK